MISSTIISFIPSLTNHISMFNLIMGIVVIGVVSYFAYSYFFKQKTSSESPSIPEQSHEPFVLPQEQAPPSPDMPEQNDSSIPSDESSHHEQEMA